LISESLGRDHGDFSTDLFVGVEVEGQLGVVPLNDKTCGLLNGFCSYATLLLLEVLITEGV
jgi:hypothetical protein